MPRTAERAAQDTLTDYWMHNGSEAQLPVDPIQIAGNMGLRVQITDLNDDISGVLFKEPGSPATIHLSVYEPTVRQRFTCGHELGHYVRRADRRESLTDFGYVDRRGYLASTGRDAGEIYANQFSAALLMPAESVRRLKRSGLTLSQLAARFRVSAESMSIRLDNLHVG